MFRREIDAHDFGQVDVLLLQEHHISDAYIPQLGKIRAGQSYTSWDSSIKEHGKSSGVCIS
eukprot:c36561_g1_i1 orf=358-540(+)